MGGNSLTVFFQIFHPLMWECNKTKREYLKMTSMNHIFWLFCVHKKKTTKKPSFVRLPRALLTPSTRRRMHSTGGLSLCCPLISLHPKKPTEGFVYFACPSAAQLRTNQAEPSPNLLNCQKASLPNDRYVLQSQQPGAPYQRPDIMCTTCEADVTFCYIPKFWASFIRFLWLCVLF